MEFRWKRNLFILWIGVFFCGMAYTLSIPFIPLFLQEDLGIHSRLEIWSGVTFSVGFLASALIAPYWGSLADKYGRKPMLIRSGLSLSVVYFITFFVHDPYIFIIVRILQGLMAGFIPAAIALVGTNTPDKQVGYALGVMSTATAAGGILGPLVGGVLSHWVGTRECFMVSGCIMLISAAIALVGVKEVHEKPKGARPSVFKDLKQAAGNKQLVWVFGMTLLVATSVMILEPLLTLYVIEIGGSAKGASLSSGIIFSAVGVATVIMGSRWGIIGQRIGYDKTLYIGLIGGGIGNLLQLGAHNLIAFGVLRFSYGLFFAAVYPALNALIVKYSEAEFRGRAISLNQTSSQFGMMAGPMLGGLLGGWIGIQFVFLITGVALLGAAVSMKVSSMKEAKRVTSG
ncbi:MFS transporter [Paenibacillus sp. N3.4]|uniref:MFS transporter n=1 Tax=Paenibacillus sp. N3.4 TaxID=2603222 RepID=UPI0011CB3F36|nr:MFS transporter [Paenibacillus sp. N3.4]TXK78407.1 multidrug efflux MFS transporter [Paenibacillus sp. N3.4]